MTTDLNSPDLDPGEAELRRRLRSELDALPVPAAPDSFGDKSSARRGAGVDRRVLIGAAAASAAGVAVAGAWWLGAGRTPAPPAAPTMRPTRSSSSPTRQSGQTLSRGTWAALPELPLSPRSGMRALHVRGSIVLVGGNLVPPCGPAALCVEPETWPDDGAILDLAEGTWRRFAHPAPSRAAVSRLVSAGNVAVFASAGRWFAVDPATAAVRTLPEPPADGPSPSTSDGTNVYGVRETDEARDTEGLEVVDPAPSRIHVLDLTTGTWDRLPEDPLGPSYDRQIVWTDAGLVVLSKALVGDPGGVGGPSFVRAAVWAQQQWRRLPDLDCIGGWNWHWTGQRVISPNPGGADGGATNGYGRVIPFHAWLDPVTGESGPLTDKGATETSPLWLDMNAGGVRVPADAHLMLVEGWLYDDVAGTWTPVDSPPGGDWVDQAGALIAGGPHGPSLIVAGGYDSAEGLTARAWRLPL